MSAPQTFATGRYAPKDTPWWKPLARADRFAIVWMVALPLVLFIVPALFGHPAIDADNLIQNFPLRVLAGQQLATGHLPLLDPLTNAGTPLLGGMNAGALYPLTLLFAFTPAIPAWLFNMIVVYVTSALGVFVLLRWHGLRTWPSFAAAISYTYTGAMIGQMVHLGVVQGSSFLPWAMVLMLALSRRFQRTSVDPSWRELARLAVPWILGTALLWGLTFLSGEPRGIADMELLALVVVPCVLLLRTSYWLRTWRTRVAYLATLAVGFAWGIGIGLVQLLPGWSFINFSQRSAINYGFFGAGSLGVRWTALLLTPDLFGGNGAFGQQGWFANYNLAEVTGYAGVLALMALAAYLTRFTWKGWRGPQRDFTIYIVIAVVGLLATWGSFTPFGHVFRAIPLFGSTRLQSRNVILVDFALAVILGWWLEQVQTRTTKDRDATTGNGIMAGLEDGFRWVTALPAIAIVALSVLLIAWGPSVVRHISITDKADAYLESGLKFINALHLVIALAAVLAVLVWRNSRHLLKILFVVLILDVAVFVIFTSGGLIGGPGPREASRSEAVQILGTKGRFALIDLGGAHTGVYRKLGEPNMNVFTKLDSVQGYGALISTIYDDATGTHPQAMVNACHLAHGTFTQLRLGVVAVTTSALLVNTELSRTVPVSCVKNVPTPVARRYFGRLLHVGAITLAGFNGGVISSTPVHVQFLNGRGQPVGRALTLKGATTTLSAQDIDLGATTLSAGFEVSSSSGVQIGDATVTPVGSTKSFQMDSDFQLAIDSSAWHLTSTEQQFSVFKATKVLRDAWLVAPASGRVTAIRNASWGDTWVSVDVSAPIVLERSEAYLPGWRATALNTTTGKTVQLSVHRAGLIEKVTVPTGNWTIHFHYHAPYIEVSTAASVVSVVAFLGVAGLLGLRRRRRRNDKVPA